MNKINIFNFALLQISSNKTKYFPLFIIAAFLVFILSSFILLSGSIKKSVLDTINEHPDLIIQKIRSGKSVDTPASWAEDFISIDGVSSSEARVYGRYYYEPAEEYFTIVGIDMFSDNNSKILKEIFTNIDMDRFLSKDYMIVGESVKKFLADYHFFKYYNFRPPDKSIQKVYIFDQFPLKSSIVSSDMIIMDISLARKILGVLEENSTDIALSIPNNEELETIRTKIRIDHFDIRTISKDEMLKNYINFFNYKSSIFILLYFFVLVSFVFILYQRYTLVRSVEKKEIGILRSLGWSINKVISLKLFENFLLFFFSFIVGVNLAYIYIFILNAPFLRGLFIGFRNLDNSIAFIPFFDIRIFVLLFFIFMIPILAAVLIPVWRISITEPIEAMR